MFIISLADDSVILSHAPKVLSVFQLLSHGFAIFFMCEYSRQTCTHALHRCLLFMFILVSVCIFYSPKMKSIHFHFCAQSLMIRTNPSVCTIGHGFLFLRESVERREGFLRSIFQQCIAYYRCNHFFL